MTSIIKYRPDSFLGRFSSLLLIIILFFNIFGYYIYFNIQQSNIRQEISGRIRGGLHDAELTIIELNSQNISEIQWIKPEKEFSFRGCLYDVAKIIEKDGRKILYCINDTKENKLVREFAKNTASSQKAKKLLNNFTSTTFLANEIPFSLINVSSNLDFAITRYDLILNIREITDPPPKFFL